MSAIIYCLYSTEDGVPRYVGKVDDKVSYRFKEHVTAALEQEPGALYQWMRDVWRSEFDVAVFTLQEGVMPKDHAMFQQYWISQFAGLLNAADDKPAQRHSALANQVIAAIRVQLDRARKE